MQTTNACSMAFSSSRMFPGNAYRIKRGKHTFRCLRNTPSLQRVEPIDEVLDQQRDVLHALASGGVSSWTTLNR